MSRYINYLIRKMEIVSELGADPKEWMKFIKLKNDGIQYRRYMMYNKRWLKKFKINTVIDIGANVGEFTLIFNNLFPKAMIYAFEPLPDCFAILQSNCSKYKNIFLHQYALGSLPSKKKINVSSWRPASSFRKMTNIHKSMYPHSANHNTVEVSIKKLDAVLENVDLKPNILIKVDVQGFEDEVIKGGVEVFRKAKVVVIECSFKINYLDEPMFSGIYALLTSLGYSYHGSLKQSIGSLDDSFLQADCIFINKRDKL